jgi:hypothetical protein
MNLLMFHRVRTAIQENASPGSGAELETVETTLRDLLMSSGVFEEVEVEHTDDPDRLVIALCQFRPFYTERDVAQRLEAIWGERVRYPFWESHALSLDQDFVEFEAASRVSENGHYVTVHLIAQRAGIPTQRTASN